MKKIFLLLSLLSSFLMVFFTYRVEASCYDGTPDCPGITVRNALREYRLNSNAVFIDVRTEQEREENEYIPNSIHLEWDREKNVLDAKFKNLDSRKTYILYCRTNNRSHQAAQYMSKERKFQGKVSYINEGNGVVVLEQWAKLGGPLEKDERRQCKTNNDCENHMTCRNNYCDYHDKRKSPCSDYGLVSGGEMISAKDAVYVLKHIVSLHILDADQQRRADVNVDGEINVRDAILILQYVRNVIDTFPICNLRIDLNEENRIGLRDLRILFWNRN